MRRIPSYRFAKMATEMGTGIPCKKLSNSQNKTGIMNNPIYEKSIDNPLFIIFVTEFHGNPSSNDQIPTSN